MSVAFARMNEAQRIAYANTAKVEIENAWQATVAEFRKNWPGDARLLFIIHEGRDGIDAEDANDIITEINLLKRNEPIDIILHTHGGSASASDRIAYAIVDRPHTTAFVPFYAESGGTEIALATQKIVFGNSANLSPVDLQLGGIPARDVVRLAKELGDRASEDLRLEAMVAEKALEDETERLCKLINRRHRSPWWWLGLGGCRLARTLASGDRFHGHPISYKEARSLGINAGRRMPKSVYRLISVRRDQLRQLRELDPQITVVRKRSAKQAEEPAVSG